MITSEKSGTICAALFAVHRDLENPRKDAKGQVRGRADYRYLSLPALIDHAKGALKEAGVFVVQEVAGDVESIAVTTRFVHLAGEWLEVGPLIMPAPADPQQRGSVTTYARRYQLAAALGLAADEDDDAISAAREREPQMGTGEVANIGEGATEPVPASQGPGAAEPRSPAPSAPAPPGGPAAHPTKPHVWGASPTWEGAKVCRIARCSAYMDPEGQVFEG